jgi:molecular chaperone DnaJ
MMGIGCHDARFVSKRENRSYHITAATRSRLGSTLSSRLATRQRIETPRFGSVRCFASGKRDLYEVLGVSKSADKGAIKKAYFNLAKKYHPDTNQGDETAMEKFKEVTAAYEVLSDEKQRGLYDQFGHAGVDPNFQASGGDGNPFGPGFQGFNFGDGSFHFSNSGNSSDIDPEELFDMFFGSGGGKRSRRNRGPRRGSDVQMQVRLKFQEAVFGAKQDLTLRYQTVNRETGETQTKERKVTVETPPGIDTGMNLRLQGQGAEGDPGAPAGNLLVQVVVDDDDYFHRDGYDVHTEVPISITQAILGGTVDVRTLNGEVELKVPKGCQPDAKLMMRSKGIQYLNSNRKGNHVVHLKIQIPKTISARQEALLREFDDESKIHGLGISGRIAHAAESAFEKMFGSKDKKKKSDSESKDESDDEGNDKKQAAQ